MYRLPRSLIRPGAQHRLKQLARDGFQTVAEMADPPRLATIRRWNDDAGNWDVFAPVEAVVRRDNTQPGFVGSESVDGSTTGGTLQRLAPWDIRVGDRVTLDNGEVVVIVPPAPYEEFGVIRAAWTADQGNA